MGRKRGEPMVLDMPGGLFGQEDVRETTSTETGGTSTQYFSIAGVGFRPTDEEIVYQVANGSISHDVNDGNKAFRASVELPHGAVVTAVVVFSDNTGDNWTMARQTNDGGTQVTMAAAVGGTEDTSITSATIDNQNFTYRLQAVSDNSENIDGARITYTI